MAKKKDKPRIDDVTISIRPLLLNTRLVAKMLSISPEYVNQLYRAGRIPAPIRLGRRLLYSYQQLQEWCEKGCPDRQTLEGQK